MFPLGYVLSFVELATLFGLLTPISPQIIQVADIPYTLNGKRVEVLVKKVSIVDECMGSISLTTYIQIINGAPLSSVNPATLSSPECLQFYHEIGEVLRAETK